MTLSDRQQLSLARLSGSLVLDLYVLNASKAWRSLYADRNEKRRRDAEIAGKRMAIRSIRRRLGRCA